MNGLITDAPLNTLPEGLLDLLGIKSFGAYPNRLRGEVAPTIDLLQSYLAANSIEASINLINIPSGGPGVYNISATNPVNLANAALQVVVPNGEVWWVQHFGIRWNIPADAANYASFTPAISMGGTGTPVSTTMGGFDTGAAAGVRGGWSCIERPVIVRPGSLFQMFCGGSNVVAGSITLTGSLRIARLRV